MEGAGVDDGDKQQERKETALRHWASSMAYDPRALFDRVCARGYSRFVGVGGGCLLVVMRKQCAMFTYVNTRLGPACHADILEGH